MLRAYAFYVIHINTCSFLSYIGSAHHIDHASLYETNCFGPIHNGDPKFIWTNPPRYRTTDSSWTESYRFKPLGILTPPIIEEIEE